MPKFPKALGEFRRTRRALVVFAIAFFCGISHADAVAPLIAVFTKETAIAAAIMLVLAILVEAGLLRWWVPPRKLKTSLWRSAAVNVTSSVLGSIAILAMDGPLMPWQHASIILPLFLLTLIVEVPLLYLLVRRAGVEWPRALGAGIGMNVCSYAFIYTIQIALVLGLFAYGPAVDRYYVKKWSDTSLFRNDSGYIYTVDAHGSLKCIDASGKTSPYIVKDAPKLSWSSWDVQGDLLASASESGLTVYRLPACETILSVENEYSDTRIAPNLKRIAMFCPEGEAVAPRDASSYYDLGSKGKLRILDLETGKVIAVVPGQALQDGMCWNSASTQLFFVSFKDQNLYLPSKLDMPNGHSFGWGYAKEGEFARRLFSFDMGSGAVRELGDFTDPVLIPRDNRIACIQGHDLCRLDPASEETEILANGIGELGYAVSPAADRVVHISPHWTPLPERYYLLMTDVRDLARRLVLEPDGFYRARWVDMGAMFRVEH